MREETNEITISSELIVKSIEISLNRNRTIRWYNEDKESITLFFPDKRLFGDVFYKEIDSSEELNLEIEFQLPEDETEKIFRYAVFSSFKEDFMEGNSSPQIIIRR